MTAAPGSLPGAAPAPTRIGRYRLLRVIGEGGMGVVHLGMDSDDRVAAVKVLRPHIAADSEARARLAREVAALRRLRHARVAEIVDVDLSGAMPFVATRYIPGPPLDAVIRDHGALSRSDLARLMWGLSEAISVIHAAGLIHRDIKPSNVLLLDGEPVIIDFGIARSLDDASLTQTGMIIGTPGYLAPELMMGGQPTRSADWWGWAAVSAFAATGRPPFGRGPMELSLDRIRRGDADLEGIGDSLRQLLRSALEPDPARRPTPEELLSSMAVAIGGPSHAPTLKYPEQPVTVADVPAAVLPTTVPATPASPIHASTTHASTTPATTRLPVAPDGASGAAAGAPNGTAGTAAAGPPGERAPGAPAGNGYGPRSTTSRPASPPPASPSPVASSPVASSPVESPGPSPAGQAPAPGPAAQAATVAAPAPRPGSQVPPTARYPVPQAGPYPAPQYAVPYPAQAYPPYAGQPSGTRPHPQPHHPQPQHLPSQHPQSQHPQSQHPQQQAAPPGVATIVRRERRWLGLSVLWLLAAVAATAVAPLGVAFLGFVWLATVRSLQWTRVARARGRAKAAASGRSSDGRISLWLTYPFRWLGALASSVLFLLPWLLLVMLFVWLRDVAPNRMTIRPVQLALASSVALVALSWWGAGGDAVRQGTRFLTSGMTGNRVGRWIWLGLAALVALAAVLILVTSGASPQWTPGWTAPEWLAARLA